MVSKPELQIKYDPIGDVLYVSIGEPVPARSQEEEPGVVWRYDVVDGKLIGVTVIDFESYWYPRMHELADHFARRFHWPHDKARRVLEHVS